MFDRVITFVLICMCVLVMAYIKMLINQVGV